jgi:hypothetical protein
MTGRQRVLAVLDRRQPDCIPFEIGGTDCSSVHVIAYRKLRELMGLPVGPIGCGCLIQLVAQTDADVMDALGVDVEVLWFGSRETKIWQTTFGVDLIVPQLFDVEDLPDGTSVVRNPQGVPYAERAADAYYHDPVGAPLADVARPPDLDRFDPLFERWDFSYTYDEPLESLAQRARRQYESTDRADVRRRLEEYGPNASLVFTQVHNIQYDVPPENILAMRDEFFRQTRARGAVV